MVIYGTLEIVRKKNQINVNMRICLWYNKYNQTQVHVHTYMCVDTYIYIFIREHICITICNVFIFKHQKKEYTKTLIMFSEGF